MKNNELHEVARLICAESASLMESGNKAANYILSRYLQIGNDVKLWHYTNLESLFGIIGGEELWLSDHRNLNDKNEIAESRLRVFKIFKDESEGVIRESLELGTTPKRTDQFLGSEHPAFIMSFSAAEDFLSQWKGYANSETGIAIEFNSQALQKISGDKNYIFAKVIYDETDIRLMMKELSLLLEEIIRIRIGNLLPIESHAEEIQKFFALIGIFIELCGSVSKQKEWGEEKEYRIVSSISAGEYPSFRISRGMIVPYVRIKIAPIDCIKRITLFDRDGYKLNTLKEYLKSKSLESISVDFSNLNYRFR